MRHQINAGDPERAQDGRAELGVLPGVERAVLLPADVYAEVVVQAGHHHRRERVFGAEERTAADQDRQPGPAMQRGPGPHPLERQQPRLERCGLGHAHGVPGQDDDGLGLRSGGRGREGERGEQGCGHRLGPERQEGGKHSQADPASPWREQEEQEGKHREARGREQRVGDDVQQWTSGRGGARTCQR